MTRGEYSTRQKRIMLNYLEQHGMEHYSVDDLVFRMEEQGEKIGRTTAYRYLEALSEQGNVRKYQNAQGITQYQHVLDSNACSNHFHMMCRKCGRLYHVNCELISELMEHIREHHEFEIDPKETVLVGLCAACKDQEKDDINGTDIT